MTKSIKISDLNSTDTIKKMIKVPFLEGITDQNEFDKQLNNVVDILSEIESSDAWNEFMRIQNWTSSSPINDLKRILPKKAFTKHQDYKLFGPVWLFSIDSRLYFIGIDDESTKEGLLLSAVKDYKYENEDELLSDLKLISSKLYQK